LGAVYSQRYGIILAKQNPGEEPGFSALIPDYSNRFILWVRALLP
jgi:hypothetical protein